MTNQTHLHPESENPEKFIKSPFHEVHWIKCPKCSKRFWFPTRNKKNTVFDVEKLKKKFTELLERQGCKNHVR